MYTVQVSKQIELFSASLMTVT